MSVPDHISSILKDSNYNLGLFSDEEIARLNSNVIFKTVRGKEVAYVKCIKRDKVIQLKPEEIVRQLYAYRLIHEYGYPKKRLGSGPINFLQSV